MILFVDTLSQGESFSAEGIITEVGNCVRSFVCRDSAYPRFIGECLLELPFQHEDNALTKDTLTSATQNTLISLELTPWWKMELVDSPGLIMLWTWLYPKLVSTPAVLLGNRSCLTWAPLTFPLSGAAGTEAEPRSSSSNLLRWWQMVTWVWVNTYKYHF